MSQPAVLDYEDAPAGPPKGALKIMFFIVMMDLIGFGIIIPLLPFYIPGYQENSLGQTFRVTLLFSVYSICQFIGSPILGLMSDRWGRRPILVLSQVGSAFGYILLGLATQPQFKFSVGMTLALVFLSRIIDGFTGGNISTAQAYISDVTTRETRAKAMGLLGAAFGIGFVLGPMIGGILGAVGTEVGPFKRFGVGLPAYAAAIMSLAAAHMTYRRLPESRARQPVVDEAWLHPRKFAPLFQKPLLIQLMFVACFSMAAFVMMECTSSLFMNTVLGWSKLKIGLYFCYLGVVISLVQGGLIGRLTKKHGEWPLAVAGPLLVTVGMLAYTLVGFYPTVFMLFIAGLFNATGRSFQGPTASALISKLSNPDEQGAVFGFYNGIMSLARVAGPLLAAPAYQYLKHTGQFVIAGVITLLCGVWTVSLKKMAAAASPEATPVPAGV